ncbi:hypothetical protein CKO27_19450 [Thiocystis violacea]|nr:hypothetical protein [Thiocystis violacea]
MPQPSLVLVLVATLLLAACNEPAPPTLSLYRAVGIGDLDQVKRHLYWGADVNQPDINGDFPLHVAARQGSVNISRALIEHGAAPLALDAAGATPMEVALATGKTQVAQMLVVRGVPLDPWEALLDLARAGVSDRDTFEFLTRRGADLNRADTHGDTPLRLAIAGGHLETVRRLILMGTDVNQTDAAGRRPLDLALEWSEGRRDARPRIVDLLKRHGAKGGRADETPGHSGPMTPQQRTEE